MGLGDRIVDATTQHSRWVIVVVLVLTLVVGSGVGALEQSSGLDQFETESEAAEKLEYVNEHFSTEDNTTSAQVFVQGENVLDRESLIATIELQEELSEHEAIDDTLADEPFADLASILATAAIQEERGEEIAERRAELEADQQRVDETAGTLTDLLNETRETQAEYDQLNASYERGEIDQYEYAAESERLESEFEDVHDRARAALTDEQYDSFAFLLDRARTLQNDLFEVEVAYERGEIDEQTRDARVAEIERAFGQVYGGIQSSVLDDEIESLQERGEALQADAEELQELEPTHEEQIEQLESMSDEEVEDHVAAMLDEDGNQALFVFLPTDFEPGSTQADARMLIVSQTTDQEVVEGDAPSSIVDSQLAMADLVDERFGENGFVFGMGIISDEIERSMNDSLLIVLPLALLFVSVVLTVAYRDLLDIVSGLVGIAFVLAWTFGIMGWMGIDFNQIMIAVPVLLVGLSIDYAIHVFMRHRERRSEGGTDTRRAMAVVLTGLGVAFVWVTATAVIGFLSNLISPVGPIRDFGLASAVGIASALLVFGVFVPALKVELDAVLESRGIDRRKRAFGTGGGRFTGVLSTGQRAAGRIPWAVVLLALVLTAAGAYGAAQVDTTFEQEDFIADDPPGWMQSLPEPFAPGAYGAKANLDYVNERFLRQDAQGQILVEGAVGDDRALTRVHEAQDDAAERDVTVVLSSGNADVRSPLTVMESVAERNESFNATYVEADTTGDGIPDRDVETVYDELFAVAPDEAADVIYRTDGGEYEALRLVISVRGDAPAGDVTEQLRDVASTLDGDGLESTATGQVVVFHVIEQELFDTVIESLLITLVAVVCFLMVVYRWIHGSAILGAITLLPIVFTVAWILGTMYALDIPFNVLTGTITSLTVGLGVAYNIHISERYLLERRRGNAPRDALYRSVTGTGGALLGSAATTVGGFGVLIFAILPPLQQFGLITGLTITYAFLGSVFVLPSMLALWTRWIGPSGGVPADQHAAGRPTVPNGAGEDGGGP